MHIRARARTITTSLFRVNDATTVEGRAAERQRRVILSAGSSVGAQGVSVVLSFLMVPIALNHFGAEQYGLWTTLTTALALFTFADLGIGNGLINAVGEAHGKNDRALAQSYIANGLALQVVVGLILAIVIGGSLAILRPDWQSIFNLSDGATGRQASVAIGGLVALTLISLPLTVAQRVRMGYQESHVNNVYLAAGVVMSFIAGIVVIRADLSLATFIACFAAGPVVAQLINTFALFKRRAGLRPALRLVDRTTAMTLLQVGSLFLILQLAGAIAYTSDNIVISSNLGAHVVPEYAVPLKLFSLPIMATAFILQPLWPAYREAGIRRDNAWIRSTLKRSLVLSAGLASAFALVFILIGQPVIAWWTNDAVAPSGRMLVLLGIYTVMYVTANALAMFYNGLHIVRYQVFTAIPMALVNIVSSIYLVRHMGPEGVVLGSIIAITLCTFAPGLIFVPRFLKKLDGDSRDMTGQVT